MTSVDWLVMESAVTVYQALDFIYQHKEVGYGLLGFAVVGGLGEAYLRSYDKRKKHKAKNKSEQKPAEEGALDDFVVLDTTRFGTKIDEFNIKVLEGKIRSYKSIPEGFTLVIYNNNTEKNAFLPESAYSQQHRDSERKITEEKLAEIVNDELKVQMCGYLDRIRNKLFVIEGIKYDCRDKSQEIGFSYRATSPEDVSAEERNSFKKPADM